MLTVSRPSPPHQDSLAIPSIWVNHAMRGLPIRLTTLCWTKTLQPVDAICLAGKLAAFAAEHLCGRILGDSDFSAWISFPISAQRALCLSRRLLTSAECELSGTWM